MSPAARPQARTSRRVRLESVEVERGEGGLRAEIAVIASRRSEILRLRALAPRWQFPGRRS